MNRHMRSFLALAALVGLAIVPAHAETQMWVVPDAANRRTCPSTACGVVGKFFHREAATVVETRNGWARVSRYYDAACTGGQSAYVDSGRADCTDDNGITNGQFAEWVRLDMLSEQRPPDPGASASGTARLVAQSDDFRRYEAEFVKAAETLMASGRCTVSDFEEQGGFMRSTNKGSGIYFTYCSGGSDRLYLDITTGRIFQ